LLWLLLPALIAFPYAGLSLTLNLVKAQFDKGMEMIKTGDLPGAVVSFNWAITLTPHFTWAYGLRAGVKADMGDHNGALDDLFQATQIDPDFAETYRLRAIVKGKLGDHKGALEDWTLALKLVPNNAQVLNGRGWTKFNLGDYKGAIEDLTRAIVQEPAFAQAYLNRGLAKEKFGDLQGAVDDFAQVIKLTPSNPWGFNNRGWVKLKLGDFNGAIADLTEAIRVDPKNAALAHFRRAVAKERLGDLEGAEDDYATFATLEPAFSTPKKTNEAVASLYKAGKFDEAIPLAKRAVRVLEKTLSPLDPELATALYNLAELYNDYRTGIRNFTEAELLYQRALAIREKALGPEHPLVATTLDDFGVLYFAMNQYSKGELLIKRALEIREKALGPNHPDVARSLNNLAGQYYMMGQFGKAEPMFLRALEIDEKAVGTDSPALVQSLNNLATVYAFLHQFPKAEHVYRRLLAIQEKAYGPEHPQVADSLKILGGMYLYMGQHEKTEALFKRALAIQEKTYGPGHPQMAAFLNHMAKSYESVRDYSKAEPLYQRALAIREKVLGPEHLDVAESLSSLAQWYETIHDYAKAEPLLQRALAIREKALGPEHLDVARSLSNMAGLYRSTKDNAKAEPLLRRALAIQEKTLGSEHIEVTGTLEGLANLHQALGQHTQAEPLYRRTLAIREKILGPDHPMVAAALNNSGFFYTINGNYAKAEPLLRRALAIQEKTGGPEDLALTPILNNLASLYAAQHLDRPAVRFSKRALLIEDRYIQNVFAITTEEEKLRFTESSSRFYFFFLSLIHQHLRTDQEAVRDGLEYVLRRKGIVLDAQSRAIEVLQGRLPETARKEWERLSTLRSELARLLLNKPEKMTMDAYKYKLASLQQQIEEAEKRLAGESALVAKELKSRTITVEAAAKTLPKNSALVEFVKIPDYDFAKGTFLPSHRYLAFVLTAAGDVTRVDLGEAGVLEAKARQALEDIQVSQKRLDRLSLARSHSSLESLSAVVWAPLEKSLGRADKVVVSPDGFLNLIPFIALIDGQGRPLVERHQLAYVASGRELVGAEGAAPKPASDLLLVANPAFDKKGTESGGQGPSLRSREFRGVFPPLPGTERESQEIPPLVIGRDDQKQVLVGERAQESAVKTARSPRILHLATHGFFLNDEEVAWGDETRGMELLERDLAVPPKTRGSTKKYENPLVRSGLAFAGANYAAQITDGDDGILTALEITGMDLYGTDLVVLSACDTGVGEVQTGEGVFGLRRAFALAGAKNLLMSLWPVSDEITANQMKAFYKKLQTLPPAEALRQAQLETIAQLKATFDGVAPPGLWAPFILQGAQALGQ